MVKLTVERFALGKAIFKSSAKTTYRNSLLLEVDFRLYGGRKQRRRIFLSLSKLECGPQEINSREICLRLTFSGEWNKRDNVEKTRMPFQGDVLATVAAVDAEAP